MRLIPQPLQHSGGGGDERWLISYADMITLLTVLFIVLYSMATTDLEKFKALSESLKEGFGATASAATPLEDEGTDAGASPVLDSSGGGTSPIQLFPERQIPIEIFQFFESLTGTGEGEGEGRKSLSEDVNEELQKLADKQGIADAGVEISYNERGIQISIYPDAVLFDPASAQLKPGIKPIIAKIAERLTLIPNHIEVQGHTDSQPMSGGVFPSNWELSAARAGAVLRCLEQNGLASGRLSAAGYAHTRPVADNSTAEGRAKNRRVELLILRGSDEPYVPHADSAGAQGSSAQGAELTEPGPSHGEPVDEGDEGHAESSHAGKEAGHGAGH